MAGQCLNQVGDVCRISHRIAELAYGEIDGVVEIAGAFIGPDQVTKVLPGDNLTRVLQEGHENLEWLILKLDAGTVSAQFVRSQVQLKPLEPDNRVCLFPAAHRFIGTIVPNEVKPEKKPSWPLRLKFLLVAALLLVAVAAAFLVDVGGLSSKLFSRFAEYAAQARSTLELAPNDGLAKWDLPWALALQGKRSQAAEQLKTVEWPMTRAVVLATLGEKEQASQSLKEAGTPGCLCTFASAMVYSLLGETDAAIRTLEKACDERDAEMVQLYANPAFDSIRSDPRFQALLHRMNFPD